MKNNFFGLKNFLESKYPVFQGNVIGDVYPPSSFAIMISDFTSFLWLVGICFMIFGKSAFDLFGVPCPWIVEYMSNNKMQTFLGLFIMNNIGHSFLATGAFEIYVNDLLLFSKIETGRFPNIEELVRTLNNMGYT